jgi:protoheme IX farnesyltransferase
MESIKSYYKLTKPGIIRGNMLSATAGFLLASKSNVDFSLLIFTLLGIALVIASGCVFNNLLDIEIDKKMERTAKRATVTGEISTKSVVIYGAILGIIGLVTLLVFTNYLTVLLGFLGLFFYVVVYGYYKRNSIHGTLVGSISGSLPPVAGYVAVTGVVDVGALILFLILATWQMPHFYAIAIYRINDYRAASLPVLPVVKGIKTTKKHIIFYMLLYILSAFALYQQDYTGVTYLAVVMAVSLWWLIMAIKNNEKINDTKWAINIFKQSLVVLLVFSFMISIESLVP